MQLCSAIAVPFIAKLLDKRHMYTIGISAIVVFQLAAWAFAKDAMTFAVMIGISYIGVAFCTSSSPAMYADASDYGEWKTGKSARGFIMGMANMPPKLGLITTGTFTGFALSAIGYVAGAPSTPELVSGLRNIIHMLPAIAAIIGLIVMTLFNKLTVPEVIKIQQEISARNEAAATK
nr:MFS transporter [Oxobacter pfennigii]